MISYKVGNILDAPAEALVNTVNTVGVMGKGIALQFKNTFPDMYAKYRKAIEAGEVEIGKVQVIPVYSLTGVRYVINFPTKKHWRHPSHLEWIKAGLADLVAKVEELDISSIAVPPLGCGNGGLDWQDVRPLIESAFDNSRLTVLVYEPSREIAEVLKEKEIAKEVRLTEVRAMLLWLLAKYRALGEEVSEFAAEKVSYFLQRFGEKQLKLTFGPGYYGPYSGKVRHVLYALNGRYLKGFEQKQSKPFEPLELMVENLAEVNEYVDKKLSLDKRNRLKAVGEFIKGFETPYGLELLASVDYIMREKGTTNADEIADGMIQWSKRKAHMFTQDHVVQAVERIRRHVPPFSDNQEVNAVENHR